MGLLAINKRVDDLSRHFSNEDIQMVNKHMKRCSTLLTIRKMKIKTTMRYRLTTFRIAVIKKTIHNKCKWRRGERGTNIGGNSNWCSGYGKQYEGASRKLEIELPHIPVIAFLGIYPKKIEALIWKDACTPIFTVIVFTIVKI